MAFSLQALKPNAKPHQTWQGQLIAQSNNWLVVHTPLGAPVRHHTKDLTYTMEHSNLGLFSNTEYYNVFIDFYPDKTFKRLYINIATPATWNTNQVTWTDLKLDIMRYPSQPPDLLDEDEFEEAKASALLSQELATKAREVATILMTQASSNEFPFLTLGYGQALQAIQNQLKN